MLLYVENKSTQQQIYQFAKEVGAKWIVVNSDHYHGNNKGYYQDVESFRSSKVFHWNNNPDDRGAISVYVTDIDILQLYPYGLNCNAKFPDLIMSFNYP